MSLKDKTPTRVVGLYNWHDGGYCVLEDGKIVEHIEIERYNRQKASGGDSLEYFQNIYLKPRGLTLEDVDHWVSPCPNTNLEKGGNTSYNTHQKLPKEKISFYSHHLCQAAHTYLSSNYSDALVLAVDSAGLDDDGRGYSITAYQCKDSEIKRIIACPEELFSLGNLWSKLTRFVFKLSAGYPRGCQAGSVMAMAALGDAKVYHEDILRMVQQDFQHIRIRPPGTVVGRALREDEEEVFHPYLNKYRQIAEENDQNKFNIAASLQLVTEQVLFDLITQAVQINAQTGFKTKNLCLVGGVTLNSVATGKISKNLSSWGLENVFVPPVPYDGGLNIGACQYHWHTVLGNPRQNEFVTPYLGEQYDMSHVESALSKRSSEINILNEVSMKRCAELLNEGNIVSIFQGRSESGRRALGNRSILANPGIAGMKDTINQKVKHRQWYRPFAPSVLEEHGEEWFEGFFPSPYMGFVFKIKDSKIGKAKAIEHFDGTARIQTVNKSQNKSYYDLISAFYELSGIPMVLNTSFNDREPICETADHALDCYLRTEIDYLYFPEYGILVNRK